MNTSLERYWVREIVDLALLLSHTLPASVQTWVLKLHTLTPLPKHTLTTVTPSHHHTLTTITPSHPHHSHTLTPSHAHYYHTLTPSQSPQTNLTQFPATTFDVNRSQIDFQWLYDILLDVCPERIVPPLKPPVSLDATISEFQRFLSRISTHKV